MPDVVPLLVLHRGRRCRSPASAAALRARLADLGVQQARGEAAALDVPQHRARRARRGDRRLAAEPRERERALRVDLADARRLDRRALGEVPEPGGGGARVEALDQADGVRQARLLDEQALEQVDAGVELAVDRRCTTSLTGALFSTISADADDDLVQARR